MSYFDNQGILVTGGTGSIGSAIVRRLLKKNVKFIRILSRDVTKQQLLCGELNNKRVQFLMGDIRDIDSVSEAVKGADIVIHTAACKHVPACEESPREAIAINIDGSLNVLQASLYEGVHACLAISTDKACEPASVMGMTKALMERLFQQYSWSPMRAICVRSGNVAGSTGSVIPLWKKQIANGGPITLTDSEMRRFFIPIEKLVDLVFVAVKEGCPGEIFVPRMPEIYLSDLAEVMTENTDVKIRIVGPRPGEKLSESIISERELGRTWARGDYYMITARGIELPGGRVIGRRRATKAEIRELL